VALSSLDPIVDFDFSNPAQSNAVTGMEWNQLGDVHLATYYPTMPDVLTLFFAKTPNCSAKVYVDQGVVLELTSHSTANIETFSMAVELPGGGHDKQIYVLVEFDVADVRWASFFNPFKPFLGAIAAVATESKMLSGKINNDINNGDKFSASTCQLRHDSGWVAGNHFRLNAPGSTGRQKFEYTPFDFHERHFERALPAVMPRIAFANRSTFPLVLEHTITASTQPDVMAVVESNLSQSDASALKYFVSPEGSNQFGSETYTDSLKNLRFAGVGLSITRTQEAEAAMQETSHGPIRVRIRRMGVYYS
jgi:hypothetical protein